MGSGNRYQLALIALLVATTALFGVFWYREIFPEYKIYQEAFVQLENFRSSLNGVPPAPFTEGVKQILMKEGKGPEKVDRCISCHVALDIEDYSPTRLAKDVNGEIRRDSKGFPLKEKNPSYIFTILDETIAQLSDPPTLELLKSQGDLKSYQERVDRSKQLEALKVAHVDHEQYQMDKVLVMHPLMGKETRPFEYHPVNDYGCTSCHGGNGRALTTDKAHGPVFDGQYQVEDVGAKPVFLERDPLHDPRFASVFNSKPGDDLLFQTTPILVGALMEAKCVQCHKVGEEQFQETSAKIERFFQQRNQDLATQENNLKQGIDAFITLINLYDLLKTKGYEAASLEIQQESVDDTVPTKRAKEVKGQLQLLEQAKGKEHAGDFLLDLLEKEMEKSIGSHELLEKLFGELQTSQDKVITIEKFLTSQAENKEANGSLFKLSEEIKLSKLIFKHISDTEGGLREAVNDAANLQGMQNEVDQLTEHYQHGRALYISQACYACHKIVGFARGGVGPELTEEGSSYPWFVKESIVWPQADLPSSTMPNMKMDHQELEDLMTFLLAQKGKNPGTSEVGRKELIKAWESGAKLPIEKAIAPSEIHNLNAGMRTFALQGCASCHRLEGFTSEVGFADVKPENVKEGYLAERWFRNLVPEDVGSREFVKILEENGPEIDKKIVHGVRAPSILETLEKEDPQLLPGFFAPFRFALREKEDKDWKDRVERVMKAYYQVYGLGRLIGPRPNWSGIYRSNEWLMEHFWNPSSHISRSIMPVFPFDDTKFEQLTYMLGELGKKNRDHLRGEWAIFGFDPVRAYDRTCAQCHGEQLKGNGPVSPWIYPIPKNLRSATFLKGLGRERVYGSIHHGVKGTPMPPWGETWPEKGEGFSTPIYQEAEIHELVDWLFEDLPQGIDQAPPKWRYTPEEVIHDLNKEGTGTFLKQGFLLAPSFSKWKEEDIFDVTPGDPYGVERERYYIKKDLYTPENIEAGRRLFLIQCAMCHGTEADGSGTRAEIMVDAKPRMLTNLDWIDTRDDLRLLRSIKFGVPGTAMTAFGDITTTWQRIELVIYIRSLSAKNLELKKIKERLYTRTAPSEGFIPGPEIRKLFDEEVKGVESLGLQIASKEGGDLLVPLYEKWVETSLPVYAKEKITPPEDQKELEEEMKKFVLFQIQKVEEEKEKTKQGFQSSKDFNAQQSFEEELKKWRLLLRQMREEFSENQRLWKDQLYLIEKSHESTPKN